jgi:tRNA threonylcarbamoyladenosine modification (KEOPS) complex Cgi121 subunit
MYATVFGISNVDAKDAGKLINHFRTTLPEGVLIQAVRADSVYGVDHVISALRITLESKKRKLLLASKLEIDLLLRIACVDQISLALNSIGLRYHKPACLILFSTRMEELTIATKQIRKIFNDSDNSVLLPSKLKREIISKRLGLNSSERLLNDLTFTSFLSEKAALLNR